MVEKNRTFLFPGQGTQYQGMALDFLAAGSAGVRELFVLASKSMGRNMEALLRDSDAETLRRSDIAQPAVTLANLAAAAFLGERGIRPAACAGHSLGEYAAMVSAGVISPEDCFTLVRERGAAMQHAADRIREAGTGTVPGMAAVMGLPPERVETLIAEWIAGGLEGLYAANFNSPRQVVISGTAEALAAARERFKEAGAKRVLPLAVAGPFHSPLMAEAAEAFAPVLEEVHFKDPAIPLFSNVSGKRVFSGIEVKELALRQITGTVRWTSEEDAILALGTGAVLETGPGRVLQGLWKDRGSEIPCYAAGTVKDIEELV
ncbi:MAG: ACP S-malonyltransferase [Treponema sp.]|jgi:[acyl-carrier-protein] S-malonyltransferase|nr:ACP S-malonyltransferase [Treponema sp.]